MLFRARNGISSFLVTPGEPMIVGRRPPESPRNVRVKDGLISRNHFRVSLVDDGVLVEDTESTSGTEVNHERIRERVVRVGDVVKINASVIYDVCRPGVTLAERIAPGPLGELAALRLLRPVMWHLTMLRFDHGEAHGALDATKILIGDRVDVIDHGSPPAREDVVVLGDLLCEAMLGHGPFPQADRQDARDERNFGAWPRALPASWPQDLQQLMWSLVYGDTHQRMPLYKILLRWDRTIAELERAFFMDEPYTWFAVRDDKIIASLIWWGKELVTVVASDANLPGLALQLRARFDEAAPRTGPEIHEFLRVTLPALGPGISVRNPGP